MKKHNLNFGMGLIIAVLVLSACGGAVTGTPTPTPTPVDIPAIFTEAARTVYTNMSEQFRSFNPRASLGG